MDPRQKLSFLSGTGVLFFHIPVVGPSWAPWGSLPEPFLRVLQVFGRLVPLGALGPAAEGSREQLSWKLPSGAPNARHWGGSQSPCALTLQGPLSPIVTAAKLLGDSTHRLSPGR